LVAVHLRHHHVEQDQVELLRLEPLQRHAPVLGRRHPMPLLGDVLGEHVRLMLLSSTISRRPDRPVKSPSCAGIEAGTAPSEFSLVSLRSGPWLLAPGSWWGRTCLHQGPGARSQELSFPPPALRRPIGTAVRHRPEDLLPPPPSRFDPSSPVRRRALTFGG